MSTGGTEMLPDARLLVEGDADYPTRATSILNGRLWAIGNLDLLTYPAIGICGSRNATESGLARAFEFGREAALKGAVVVSGYAKGVDRQAHRGALEASGCTIAVLPEGIRHFRLIKELADIADTSHNFLAISGFEPDTPWKAWHAMERNKLIVALSQGLFVIEAREKGGTIDAANESKRQCKPVYVVQFATQGAGREGNKSLLADSIGQPVRNLRDLKGALDELMSGRAIGSGQLSLISDNKETYRVRDSKGQVPDAT